MREKMVITLYDSFTNIDDRFLQEAALQSSSMHKGFLKKRVLLIAAIMGAILLCGFAALRHIKQVYSIRGFKKHRHLQRKRCKARLKIR